MEEIEKIQDKAYSEGLQLTKLDWKLAQKQLNLFGENDLVLDIGCNTGDLTKIIANKNKVIGMELSEGAVKKAKERGLKALQGSIYKIPFKDNSFDKVHLSEVIEHLLNTDQALKEILRVLKPNGELIITTPNCCSFRDRILILFGHLQAYALHEEHVKLFNKKRLVCNLKKSGFKIKKIYGTGFSIPIPKIPITIFNLDRILPATMMQRLIIVAKK
jgi:ubiquinone/menaquinone biosynthesis C-methylase UbiE